MRVSEAIAVAYFAYLAAAAAVIPLPISRRRRIWTGTAVAAASLLLLSQTAGSESVDAVRDWFPAFWLLLGYWLPAAFVTKMHPAFENTLLALDERMLGRPGPTRRLDRLPQLVNQALELAYLFCYPLVPMGLVCLYLGGLESKADQFWTAVLLAGFACYGVLPWVATRPPRLVEPPSPRMPSPIRRLNLEVLQQASTGLNTFPSGHAATSLATTFAVAAYLPGAGVLLGVIALGISIGSVTGRYHYAADSIAGAAVAVLAFALAQLVTRL
jgi:membrane-associated phospholipid phosphatase